MRFSLSAKISLLIAALLVGLGLVVVVAFGLLSARQIDRTIESDAVTTGKQLSLYLTERSSDLQKRLLFAATGAPRVRDLVFADDAPTTQAEISNLAKEFSVDAVQVLGPEGAVLGQSPSLDHLESRGRAVVQTALQSGTQQTSVVRDGSTIWLISAAQMADHGYVKGAIAFFQRLGQRDVMKLSAESGYVLAFTAGGQVVARSISEPLSPPAIDSGPEQFELGGHPYVSIARSLPDTSPSEKIGFMIVQPTGMITAPYAQVRKAFVSVLFVALLLSLAAGLIFGRGIVGPIESLASAARVIQHGEWPAAFEVVRQDEIGILQRSFNDMAAASKMAQDRLLAMIDLDPLTELINHRHFRERLVQEARRSEAGGDRMALALVDLDGFDDFNERAGHTAGDQALRLVANTIQECTPEFAISGRYAGDRFSILLPGASTEDIVSISTKISTLLQQKGCSVTVSAGCSEFPKNSLKEDGLILAAELALARAKQLGRDRVCAFDAVPGADQAADPFHLFESMDNGSFATIQALAAAVDAKDAYTNGHSERVARYAADLSSLLGDAPTMVDRIFRCGALHDVGKIGVPDSILKKPGRLDADEQRVMETHPVLGEMIAGKVPQLAELLPGIRHHHEKWDGTGYPDQLAGSQIPYIARVLAVADTFDAMTSDRPYRKGLALEIALGEIEKNAGKQFDPRLAEAFVRLMRRNEDDLAA